MPRCRVFSVIISWLISLRFLPEYLLDADKVAAKRRAHELGIKQAKFQEIPDNVPAPVLLTESETKQPCLAQDLP